MLYTKKKKIKRKPKSCARPGELNDFLFQMRVAVAAQFLFSFLLFFFAPAPPPSPISSTWVHNSAGWCCCRCSFHLFSFRSFFFPHHLVYFVLQLVVKKKMKTTKQNSVRATFKISMIFLWYMCCVL